MSNWKTGWCIGSDIELIPDSSFEPGGMGWRPDSVDDIVDHLDNVFRFLGKKDCDVVHLYFLLHKRQTDICQLLDRTQPAVSYDIKRTKEHINFVIYLLSVIDDFLVFLEKGAKQYESDQIQVLVLLFFSTSFTKTSKIMNCHQITCRHLFDKTMKSLKKDGYDDVAEIFDNIVSNLNMIKKTIADV